MSLPTPRRSELDLGGRSLSFETGKIAKQADGSVVARLGDTVVLVTACADRKPRVGADFIPLTVDYREYTYAAGKIPGGFFKREGRPTEKEILTSRQIDRPIRPLFPEGWNYETQVVAMVLSADAENNPDVLAVTAAGAALYLSDIPFVQPVAGVRIGLIDGAMVVNPTYSQLEDSTLDLTVVGTETAIVMVEAGAREVSEKLMVEAIDFAHQQIRQIVAAVQKLAPGGMPTKRSVNLAPFDPELMRRVEQKVAPDLRSLFTHPDKKAREIKVSAYVEQMMASFDDLDEAKKAEAKRIFSHIKERTIRNWILNERIRPDGRSFEQVRPITCEVGVLPRTHGSAIFTRGETQALVTATLGTSADTQKIEALEGEEERRFLLHYNFPPFSVGEVKFLRGPGRREIGHGALACRALEPMIPSEAQFPYTVRVVSDILESNGSSSMASICGGSLALMDAGVPLKAPVAGAAMGLVLEGDKYAVLTDIAGYEDHYGDMDFKVAGTAAGITALQMDIKVEGVTSAIMQQALSQARDARLEILENMGRTLSSARDNISVFAPRILTIQIPKDKIRDVIGPGGKVIRSIVDRTGCKIEVEDDGTVAIASTDENAAKLALDIINELVAEAEIGKTYVGKVARLVEFGAFVEILPGRDGLLHISEVAHYRVEDIHSELKEGQDIMVKVISIDHQGRVKLSRKALLEAPPGSESRESESGSGEGRRDGPPRREHGGGQGRGGFRGGNRGHGGGRGPGHGGGRRDS